MSDHFRTVCSCGQIIAQCRCPGPKTETVIENGCATCKAKLGQLEWDRVAGRGVKGLQS